MEAGARGPSGIPDAKGRSGLIWITWTTTHQAILSLGLAELLKREARIVRAQKAPEDRPDVVVVCSDAERVVSHVGHLRTALPETPTVAFGPSPDLELVRGALHAGACGFVHAGMKSGQILRALSLATEGECVVPSSLVKALVYGEEDGPVDLSKLTFRQREILEILTEGLTNAEIAKRLFLSEFTIKQHLRAAYKQLGVRNRIEAARLLSRSNLGTTSGAYGLQPGRGPGLTGELTGR